ncbi:MAG: glycosyltransferase family 4 protein [Acidimicrobiales bacterium]
MASAGTRRRRALDLHQVVPVAMRYPRPAQHLGVPMVIGPVGGSLDNPEGFGADRDTAPWYVALRRLDGLRLRWDPLLRRTYDSADLVLVIAPYAEQQLRRRRVRRFEVMSETALEEMPTACATPSSTGPVRLLYVGRIVRTKGLRDALRAIAAAGTGRSFTLDVVGDGFDRATCEAIADELGLRDIVHFHGRLARPEVEAFYRRSDVFVFPSYREPGGNVVLEAMSHGLPVITCDRGGPGTATTDACAIRLAVHSPQQFVDDLAGAISQLVDDEALRRQLGRAGREHVAATAMWDRKVAHASRLYQSVLAARGGADL